MKLWVSGSIALDLIMDFPGRFKDYIDPGKIHILNLSFEVSTLKQNIGGCAANIAYNLALLGERPEILGSIGRDQIWIRDYFRRLGIGVRYLKISRKLATAKAYIITDKNDNQIAGFYAGAAQDPISLPIASRLGDWAVIAPENPKNMVKLARFYARRKINYIFDPGQQITSLSKKDLAVGLASAKVLIGNDYEIGLILSSLRGRKAAAISNPLGLLRFARNDIAIVRTLGPRGSEIITGRRKIKIGIAKPKKVFDPTGAGDAYRAGFLKGCILGYDLKACGQLGATGASYAVEKYGTQNHKFSWASLVKRYNQNFRVKIQV